MKAHTEYRVEFQPTAHPDWPHMPRHPPPCSVWVSSGGQVVRVSEDGRTVQVIPGGYPHSAARSP